MDPSFLIKSAITLSLPNTPSLSIKVCSHKNNRCTKQVTNKRI